MDRTDALSTLALDELPANVAVVDADGVIRLTNEGWEAFGRKWGRETGDVGENYFRAGSEDDEAVEGIRAVLRGDRDLYTYEYPCHTPSDRHWFVMRVTRFEHDGDPYAVVAHVDVTDRKLAELETEHLVDRVEGLVTDVTSALVAATTRDEIATGVVDAVAAVPAYASAWLGRVTRSTEDVEVLAASGDTAPDGPWSLDDDSLPARAARSADVVTDGETVAVPLATTDTTYGVLVVDAAETGVFDARERRVLGAVGRTVATAFQAVDSSEALSAANVVAFELESRSDALFVNRLSAALDCALDFRGTVSTDGDAPLVYFEVSGTTRTDLVAWAADDADVASATVLAEPGDALLVEFETVDAPFTWQFSARGVVTRDVTVADGVTRLVLELPAGRDAREVVDNFREDYGDADLVAYRETERPTRSAREVWADLDDALTDRQRTALTKAYLSGFFEWPRPVTGDDLAESMGITRSTFHQHLRTAEQKLAAAYLDKPN